VSGAFCCSRTFAQEAIAAGRVLVNGRMEKKRYCAALFDRIVVSPRETAPVSKLQVVDMPFDVLFEDEDLFVINKPAGLVVHPAPEIMKGLLSMGFWLGA
jgi:23S rRNA pseudouridine1911/1915/1917 synthase